MPPTLPPRASNIKRSGRDARYDAPMARSNSDQRLAAFARENPLPRRPEEMAEALLDLAALFFSRNDLPAGGELDLTLIYRDSADACPGAFLSNPAVLPNTRTPGAYGWSLGSLGCGFLFSYPHYQEDTLGPALLLCAASPRTRRPAAPPSLYAQALLLLFERGDSARVGDRQALERIADGTTPRSELRHWSSSYGFDAAGAARLRARGVAMARSADCLRLALEETKPDVLSERSRLTLSQWASRADAASEAAALAASAGPARAASRPRL